MSPSPKDNLTDFLYNQLEREGEKQKLVQFVSMSNQILYVILNDGKEYTITVTETPQ